MLKLKLQYSGHLMWRADSFEKTLMLGNIEGRRKWRWQRMRWLYGIIDLMDMSLSKLQELVMDKGGLVCCNSWGRKEWDTTERLNSTETAIILSDFYSLFYVWKLFILVLVIIVLQNTQKVLDTWLFWQNIVLIFLIKEVFKTL